MNQRKKIKIRQKNTGQPIQVSSRTSSPNWKLWWKKNAKTIGIVAGGISFCGLLIFLIASVLPDSKVPKPTEQKKEIEKPIKQNITSPAVQIETTAPSFFDFDLSAYEIKTYIFPEDKDVFEFLRRRELSRRVAREFSDLVEDEGLEKFERGHEFYTLTSTDGLESLTYIYKITDSEFAVFQTEPEPTMEIRKATVTINQKSASAIIRTNFLEAIIDNNIPYEVIEPLESALKWSVDFHHLSPGDRFKVIYQEETINDKPVGIRQIDVISFETQRDKIFACYVDDIDRPNFFDYYGRTLVRKFLKSPVKFGRISSNYNLDRFHPVLKKVKPHLGTDYSAPSGTPIYAVADGKIILATHTANNGNYIKIRHDKIYETQYLHMSKFANGIKNGTRVKQGQLIGYVGETGLASGPHVCFRFWKNGQQIDFLKEKLVTQTTSNNTLDEEDYIERRDAMMEKLDAIKYDAGLEF